MMRAGDRKQGINKCWPYSYFAKNLVEYSTLVGRRVDFGSEEIPQAVSL